MDKKLILKIVGVVGVVGGTACLYLSGIPVASVTGIVGGVFALAALIAVIFA
jgi:hypothetical protein